MLCHLVFVCKPILFDPQWRAIVHYPDDQGVAALRIAKRRHSPHPAELDSWIRLPGVKVLPEGGLELDPCRLPSADQVAQRHLSILQRALRSLCLFAALTLPQGLVFPTGHGRLTREFRGVLAA